ncbi:hypothetical protein [Lentzea sp. NPDC004782]|uniref:hypothetical protein n=1 Tax=Lentzea sp. NPDC004782 TaxID=3154458 RepID=UPI0033BA74FD
MRIDEVHRLATDPAGTAGQSRLAQLTQALNKVALIASDCGLADLARELCWRQFTTLQAAASLPAEAAQYALEPIVNLGRLATRRGDGGTAYQLYQDTYRAVTTGTSTNIDGHDVDFGDLAPQPDGRQNLQRFLQAILVADGTRALTTAGLWDRVLPHLQRCNGVSERMLDGRQAAVLAYAMCGCSEQALALIDSADTPMPWERAVAACLRTLCLRLTGRPAEGTVTAMIDAYQALPLNPAAVVFHTRLGLCVGGLAAATCSAASEEITTNLVRLAVQASDAHAADLLARCLSNARTESFGLSLACIIEDAGLNQQRIPQGLLSSLTSAAELAQAALSELIADGTFDLRPGSDV